MSWLRRRKRDFQPQVRYRDPLQAVPIIAADVKARSDSVGLQLRRTLPPRPGVYAWFSRRLGYQHEIRINLDKQGSFYWRQIDGRRTLGEIADLMAAEFQVEEQPCREAVIKFTRDLMLRNLLVVKIDEMEK